MTAINTSFNMTFNSWQRILTARFAIVSHKQFGPCRTVFD